MFTTLNYGDIELRDVHTLLFDQTAIRDSSDTDILYWRYDIRVSTIIYLSDAPDEQRTLGWSDNNIVSLAELEAAFRQGLEKDRQRLIYAFSGVPVLDVYSSLDYSDEALPPLGKTNDWGKIDVDNGPKVQDISVVHVSPRALRVRFGIRVCLGCDSSAAQIASNRWTSIDTLNEDFRTTRTWRGRLRLRAMDLFKENGDPEDAQLTPHHFRDLVIPPLATGFRRRTIDLQSEPNGLELAYTVTDEEIIGSAAPQPATRIKGYHTEAAGPEASMCIGNCQIQLWGRKGVPKGTLINMALNLAANKLLLQRENGGQHYMQLTSVTDLFEMDESSIVVNMRALHVAESTEQWASMVLEKMGQKLELAGDVDPDVAEALITKFASAGIAQSLACYLQDPCGTHSMPRGKLNSANTSLGDPSLGQDPGRDDIGGTRVTFQPVAALPHFEPPTYSEGHLAAMYLHYNVDVRYDSNQMRVALPIALGAEEPNDEADSVKLIALARPVAKMRVRISGERTGNWPNMPKKEDFSFNGITCWVLDYKLNARPPRLTGDGTSRLYVSDLEICYQMSRAPMPAELLVTSKLPWDELSGPASGIPDSAFVAPSDFFLA